MATLIPRRTRRGKRVWAIRYHEGRGGPIRQISTGTGDRRLAQEIKNRFESDLLRQRWNLPRPVPLKEVFRRHLEYLKNNNRSASTIERCEQVQRAFLQFSAGRSLNDDLAESYKTQLRQSGRSPAGINSDLRFLKAAFNWGAKRGLCSSLKIEMMGGDERRLARFLSEDEIARFFAAVETAPVKLTRVGRGQDEGHWRGYWRMIFDLYLVTGGRKEEVARLTWGDVDFDRRLITFSGTKSRKERQVWINDILLRDLRKFRGCEHDRIFHHDGDWAYSMYRYYAQVAGLTDPEKRKLHVLRHTCAYLMLSNGVDPITVQQVLGHASVKTTLDRYGHSTPARKVEAGQILDRALEKILAKR